ncbi:MAG: MFS transporter [Anaerolineae bacterium]|nr:MAG: MFS transporter [Anaerolineae bacterium]
MLQGFWVKARMKEDRVFSPLRVLLPVGIGTCLSLLGDASLYAVLPTHTADAGVSVASVGALLSANRFIRLVLNGPGGMAYDRWRRRRLFVPALFIGAFSTALYGLTEGFWPLFIGRLLWGLAWVGIWIGGNTIVLDIASHGSRGRWVGAYHVSFFLGSAGGSLLGGFLTDRLGYHQAMTISAILTCLGAFVALAFLPETRGRQEKVMEAGVAPRPIVRSSTDPYGSDSPAISKQTDGLEFASAMALYAAHRIAMAGVLSSTFGFFLLERMGERIQVAGRSLGVATATGLGLGLSTLIAAASAPIMGGLSDRAGNRWRVAAGGLVPGVAGFSLLAAGLPLTTLFGVPLTAITGGSNQGLSTALIGDLGNVAQQSRRLGVLFTIGDLASAVGPPLAYALIPSIGIRNLYLLVAVLFASVFIVLMAIDTRQRAFSGRQWGMPPK